MHVYIHIIIVSGCKTNLQLSDAHALGLFVMHCLLKNERTMETQSIFWHRTVSKVALLNLMHRCGKQSCVHRRFTVQTFFFACSDDGTMFPLPVPTGPTWPFSKWTPCVVGTNRKAARLAMQETRTHSMLTEVWAAKICCRCSSVCELICENN